MPECAEMHAITSGIMRKHDPVVFACNFGALLLISTLIALVPFGVNLNPANSRVNVVMNEALAVEPVSNAEGYIQQCAQEAGMDSAEFVAAVANMGSAYYGYNIVNQTGVSPDYDLSDNLAGLIETADYPDYDLLSAREQQDWISKENYDAAKFNSLLKTLGMNSLDGWYSSGGNNVDFPDDEKTILDHIGIIGDTWKRRAGVAFSDINAIFDNRQVIPSWSGEQIIKSKYKGEMWPSGVPRNLNIGRGTRWEYLGNTYYQDYRWQAIYLSDTPIYYVTVVKPDSTGIMVFMASEDTWRYGNTAGHRPESEPTVRYTSNLSWSYGGYSAYVGSFSTNSYIQRIAISQTEVNMPLSYAASNSIVTNDYLNALTLLIGAGVGANYEKIPDYPEQDVPDDTQVYFPEEEDPETGEPVQIVNNETNWINFITKPDVPEPEPEPEPTTRPDNPYNPQNPDPDTGEPTSGTGTPQWREETEENVLPLMDIKFDNLFPFSMLFDISKLFNKVDSMTQIESGSGVYNSLTIPFIWSDNSNDAIVLDLTALHDLLLMVRIFNQLLLGAFLLFTCIEFWRGILTG